MTTKAIPNLSDLVALFFDEQDELAAFQEADPNSIPTEYRQLLAHNHHMTVTVEQFFGSKVDVQVLDERFSGESYSRKIILRRQDNSQVVQFGIVRLNLNHLAPDVVTEIQKKETPLGRILIERNVLRVVELSKVWRFQCGAEMAETFHADIDATTFGRTAMIHCDGDPAIELLEIITPNLR